ncbi:hypothetical protein PVT01_030028300, partial [Plasmodium vivax]
YPFLNKVLTRFNEFNETVKGDKNENHYIILCNQIIGLSKGDKNVYNDFCVKLLRNLGHHSKASKYFNPNHERCNILYNWIYNTKKNDIHSNNIINECFDDYNRLMKHTDSMNRCSYFSHDRYVEPIKISILNIFYDNMDIIKGILTRPDDSKKNSCLKFVCECIKIYKDIYDSYCVSVDQTNEKHRTTCLRLGEIKNTYKWYFSNQDSLNSIIPSLDNINDDYLVKCTAYMTNKELSSERRTNLDTLSRLRITGPVEGSDGNLQDFLPTSLGEEGNSVKKTITTTVGTVAGASSLLALLYK